MIIVSNASPLISFAILNNLHILNSIFEEIIIPDSVYKEITVKNKPYFKELIEFSHNRVRMVKNELAVEMLLKDLDKGEAEVIVIAKENGIKEVLMDDYKGRRIAKLHSLFPIGTIGVLLHAKRKGMIDSLKPELDKLISNHIRISKALYRKALMLAGE